MTKIKGWRRRRGDKVTCVNISATIKQRTFEKEEVVTSPSISVANSVVDLDPVSGTTDVKHG
jgi:hypothetical protein